VLNSVIVTKQLYFYVSDVMLLYTCLPSLPHTLCTTVDHKRLSVFGVDYRGQESGHLRTTSWRRTGDCTETWTHTNKARKLNSHFTIF